MPESKHEKTVRFRSHTRGDRSPQKSIVGTTSAT